MAYKKTAGKKTSTKKSQAKESDFSFEVADGAVKVDLYERQKGYNVKFTLADCFVIYGRVVIMDDYCFVSYPSFKGSDGKYVNQAYCFDKDINQEINDAIGEFVL